VLPLEFVVEVFISPLKGFIAHELAERGYSQSRIGQLLGISQPAVSTYLKNPKTYYEERLLRVGWEEGAGELDEVCAGAGGLGGCGRGAPLHKQLRRDPPILFKAVHPSTDPRTPPCRVARSAEIWRSTQKPPGGWKLRLKS